MTDATRVMVRPRPGISAKEAQDARARAWTYVFECFHLHKENEGGPETAPEDAERRSNGIGADEASIPRQAD